MTHRNPLSFVVQGLIVMMWFLLSGTAFAAIQDVNDIATKTAGDRFLYSEFNKIVEVLQNFWHNDSSDDVGMGQVANPSGGVCTTGYTHIDLDNDSVVENGECWYGAMVKDGKLGLGTVAPSSLLDLQQTGTAKANADIFEITNSGNAADMDATESSILFNQFYYDATTPAVADSARISAGTEQDWTSTGTTQDSYLAFKTAADGTLAERARISSAGYFGIGTTSPDRLIHTEVSDSATNAVSYGQRLSHITSGTPAAGLGAGLEFEVETAADNNEILGAIEGVSTVVTGGSEEGALVFKTMTSGAAAVERMRIKGTSVGIGTATPDRLLHSEVSDALTTAVTPAARFTHVSTNTPDVGLGTSIEFETETANGNNEVGGAIESLTTDVTSGQEDFAMIFKTMDNGATAAERVRVTSTGYVGIGTGSTVSGNLHVYQASPTANQTLFLIGTSDDASRFSVDEDGDVGADGTITAAQFVGGGAGLTGVSSSSIDADTLNWDKLITAMTLDETTTVDMDTNTADLNFDSGTLYIDNAGYIGVGTTSPSAPLTLANDSWIAAKDNAGTGIVNLFKLNTSDQIEIGGSLYVPGGFGFPEDSGVVTAFDMPVSSSATTGTAESYAFKVDGTNVLKVYAESDGAGGMQNPEVFITGDLTVSGTTTLGGNVTIDADSINTDVIGEKTAAAGVTIDGLLLKDNGIGENLTVGPIADPALILDGATASDTDFWVGVTADEGGDDDDKFQIGDGTIPGTNPFVTVDTSGQVGIGQATPSGILHIYGTVVDLFKLERSGAANSHIEFKNSNGSTFVGIDGANRFSIGPNTDLSVSPYLYINAGSIGIGTTSPDRLFHTEISDAGTNTVTYAERLSHITSGTPAASIGVGLEFEQETSADNNEVLVTIETIATDVTATSEDADIIFKNMAAGAAAAETFRITSDGWLGKGTTKMFKVNSSGQIDVGSTLNIGTLNLAADSGVVGLVDMSVTSSVASGDDESYSFSIDSNPILTVFSESDAAGGITNPRVGIGTISPSSNLHVYQASPTANQVLFQVGTSDAATRFSVDEDGDVTIAGNLDVNGTSSFASISVDAGGDVGIGSTPSSRLDVEQAGTAKANTDMFEITNSGNAADMDATATSIIFNQFYYDAATPAVADSARISAGTEQDWTSTASTQDSYLAFETALNGTVTENMRLSSAGNLGIGTGTTAPAARIESLSTTEQLRLSYDASNYAAFTTGNAGDITINATGDDVNISDKLAVSHSFSGSTAYTGADSSITYTNSSADTNSTLTALRGYMTYAGSNEAGNLSAVLGRLGITNTSVGNTTARGVSSLIEVNTSGKARNLASYTADVQQNVAATTVTNYYGYAVGDITSIYDVSSFVNSGTIANTYGVYIGDMTEGTQTNTPYGIYQSDTGMKNYFGGTFGIGTTSPDRSFHTEVSDAVTNATTFAGRLSHITSGTPAASIGVGLEFEQETSADNNEVIATIEGITTDVTGAAEDGALLFKTMNAGAAATEKLRIGDDNVRLTNGTWLRSVDNAGTGYINMFKVNASDQIEVGGPLSVPAGLSMAEDSGVVTALDMPVSSSSTDGDEMSTTFRIDGTNILKVKASANGSGGVDETQVIVSPGAVGNLATLPSLAFGTGANTGFYESADNVLEISIAGANDFTLSANSFKAVATAPTAEILAVQGTATVPTYSLTGDNNTGIGSSGADALSLISGGKEMLRLSNTATTDSLQMANNDWLAAVDNAGTGNVNMFKVGTTDEVYVGSTFNVGTIEVTEDSGPVTLVNLPVSSSAADNTEESYSFMIDSDNILKVKSLSDGAGGSDTEQVVILPGAVGNLATFPSLAFGDADTGFYESVDDVLQTSIAGTATTTLSSAGFSIGSTITTAGRPIMLAETASATNPVFALGDDYDTGIGTAAADQLSLISGAQEMLRLTETGTAGTEQVIISPSEIIGAAATPGLAFGDGDSGFYESADDTLHFSTAGATRGNISAGGFALSTYLQRSVTATITASTTQTQGQGALTADVNEVATVANANDTVTLPSAVAGMEITVINNGANTLKIFPASGDNLGAGVDTSTTLAVGSNVTYASYNATNWEVK